MFSPRSGCDDISKRRVVRDCDQAGVLKTERPGLARPYIGWRRHSASVITVLTPAINAVAARLYLCFKISQSKNPCKAKLNHFPYII
jgi:hypothetical protein